MSTLRNSPRFHSHATCYPGTSLIPSASNIHGSRSPPQTDVPPMGFPMMQYPMDQSISCRSKNTSLESTPLNRVLTLSYNLSTVVNLVHSPRVMKHYTLFIRIRPTIWCERYLSRFSKLRTLGKYHAISALQVYVSMYSGPASHLCARHLAPISSIWYVLHLQLSRNPQRKKCRDFSWNLRLSYVLEPAARQVTRTDPCAPQFRSFLFLISDPAIQPLASCRAHVRLSYTGNGLKCTIATHVLPLTAFLSSFSAFSPSSALLEQHIPPRVDALHQMTCITTQRTLGCFCDRLRP